MSSTFDIAQQALSLLRERVRPGDENARVLLYNLKRLVDSWHDCHHDGCACLNRAGYKHAQALLTVLQHDAGFFDDDKTLTERLRERDLL